mmetsp:Transcript_109593/g.186275  ORF Transcript_109593/g.186275 Transcript_109593/m.186275 type:complete len:357 (-) Transcript_109593:144-1214(-)
MRRRAPQQWRIAGPLRVFVVRLLVLRWRAWQVRVPAHVRGRPIPSGSPRFLRRQLSGAHQRPCSRRRKFELPFLFQFVRHQAGHPDKPDKLLLQNIRVHVNDVFDAHCAHPIADPTSTTTSQALHFQLAQTQALCRRAEVHRPLRRGGATRTNRKALQNPLRHLSRAARWVALLEVLTGCCSRLGVLGPASQHALHAQGPHTGVQQQGQPELLLGPGFLRQALLVVHHQATHGRIEVRLQDSLHCVQITVVPAFMLELLCSCRCGADALLRALPANRKGHVPTGRLVLVLLFLGHLGLGLLRWHLGRAPLLCLPLLLLCHCLRLLLDLQHGGPCCLSRSLCSRRGVFLRHIIWLVL